MFYLFRCGIRHRPLPALGWLSVPMQSYGCPDVGIWGVGEGAVQKEIASCC